MFRPFTSQIIQHLDFLTGKHLASSVDSLNGMEEYSEVAKKYRRLYNKVVEDQNASLKVFLPSHVFETIFFTIMKTQEFRLKEATGLSTESPSMSILLRVS